MKKVVIYVIASVLCAVVVAVLTAGYILYEYRANMAFSIGAPIGVCLCFVCFCVAELICIHANKFKAAIALSAIKYALLFIGTFVVFHHTLQALGFMMVLGLAIPILFPAALSVIVMRPLVFVPFIIFYIGIIAEIIIIAFTKKRRSEQLENPDLTKKD